MLDRIGKEENLVPNEEPKHPFLDDEESLVAPFDLSILVPGFSYDFYLHPLSEDENKRREILLTSLGVEIAKRELQGKPERRICIACFLPHEMFPTDAQYGFYEVLYSHQKELILLFDFDYPKECDKEDSFYPLYHDMRLLLGKEKGGFLSVEFELAYHYLGEEGREKLRDLF